MSAAQTSTQPTKKKFGKGERLVPTASQKAQTYYQADDQRQPRKTRKFDRPTKYRPSLQPGTILILLAGRFRGKRVVLLRTLGAGVLLVTGPFKANGVPLRRVNARYVIATSQRVEVSGLDEKVLEKVSGEGYFTKDKVKKGKSEEAFFAQGQKPEKKQIASDRAEDQKAIDKALLANIKKADPLMLSYLHASFSLRNGDRPHEMKF